MTTRILTDWNGEAVLVSNNAALLDHVRLDNAGGETDCLTFYLGAPSAKVAHEIAAHCREVFAGTEWSIREALAPDAPAPYYVKFIA